MKKGGIALAVFIALGLVERKPTSGANGQTTAVSPRQAAEGASGAAAKRNPEQQSLGQLLCDYFQPGARSAATSDWACVPESARIDVLIVTVPDPESTHLALEMDRFVESVTWAATDSDFVLSKYRFPWKQKPEKETSASAGPESEQRESDERRKQPGLMLFRDNSDPPQPDRMLLVYLVPEEPTSGVSLTVLDSVLSQIQENPKLDQTLRIVGPAFSGSIAPLGKFLDYKKRHAEIVSGSATDTDSFESFQGLYDVKNIHLRATTEGDKRALRLFRQYLDAMWPSGEVAWLSEDETFYGAVKYGAAKQGPQAVVDSHWLAVRYPRDIARLRNVYQDAAARPGANGEQPAVQDPNRLDLKSSSGNAFVAPESPDAFSDRLSPASQQGALIAISAALRREQVRYAGIAATDVLDTLFIASFLRKANPDLRLFVLDSDLLFMRESENTSLTGLLSITSYPLFGRNQHWTNARFPNGIPRLAQFTSRGAEGVYNAARWLIPYTPPPAATPGEFLLEYSRPVGPSGTRPPLWLTVLGRDGNWPLALLDEQEKDRRWGSDLLEQPAQANDPPNLNPEPPTRDWLLLFPLIAVFGCVHTWYALGTSNSKQTSLRRLVGRFFWAHPEDEAPSVQERTFLLVITLAAAGSLFLLTTSAARFSLAPGLSIRGHDHFSEAVYFVVDHWAFLYLLLGAGGEAYMLYGAWRLWRGRFERAPHYETRVLLPAGALTVAVCALWSWLIFDDRFQAGYFVAYRSLHLTNGVTPALPLLLAAFGLFAWAWMQGKRARMTGEHEAVLDKHRSSNSAGREFAGDVKIVDEAIKDIFSARIWIRALGWVALLIVLQWPFWAIRSFEAFRYDLACWCAIFAVDWLIAVCWVQFREIWSRFRKYLQSLERHPLRNAFSRLEKQVNWVPLVTQPDATTLLISSRCMDSLRVIASFPGSEFAASVCQEMQRPEDLETSFHVLESSIAGHTRLDRAKYTTLQYRLDLLQALIDRLLQDGWKPGDPLADNDQSSSSKLRMLAEEFLALRQLMYMRYVFRHLRNLLGFVITGFIVVVLALNVYPFAGQQWLAFTAVVAFVVLGVGVAKVFADMDRDKVLSRITVTPPGKLGSTFFVRVAQFGALPVVTLLAAQFPSITRFFFSWLQPALDAVR
jgi:hypothetical protein